MSEKRRLAVVTWFNKAKGYGEAVDKKGYVYFLRRKDMNRGEQADLKKGNSITFRLSPERVFGLSVAEDIRCNRKPASQQLLPFRGAEACL